MTTKQVDKAHYEFASYMSKRRWASLWHQLDEVIRLQPNRLLEVGPGPGLFKAAAGVFGISVETLDIDPELKPDHVGSVLSLPFEDGAFDLACAFQMLEHMPFDRSLKALGELSRVAQRAVIISLPDAKRCIPVSICPPGGQAKHFLIPRPRFRRVVHKFNGEHYWEINTVGYELQRVIEALQGAVQKPLGKTYRVPEHPYHRFFVFGA